MPGSIQSFLASIFIRASRSARIYWQLAPVRLQAVLASDRRGVSDRDRAAGTNTAVQAQPGALHLHLSMARDVPLRADA
jgi:hypothetical protein